MQGACLQDLLNFLDSNNKTVLCAGPLSSNIIDVAIEFSESAQIPVVLVASRRQIESHEFGSGYVNNWSTESFVKHVRIKKSDYIFIERDHGGPWQGTFEISKNLDLTKSMAVAKRSFEVDIDSGVQILHIDPTIPIGDEILTMDKILDRLFELYTHVVEYARQKNKIIAVELGTEEQNGSHTDLQILEEFLEQTHQFCRKNKFNHPLFVVVQTGTKVVECRNIGAFETETEDEKIKLIKNIEASAAIASKYKIYLKEHNADYLSYENLCIRPKIGIKASNVAPEFGFIETTELLSLLKTHGAGTDCDRFVEIVNLSGKWKKWLLPGSQLSDLEKARLAGHYCYAHPEIVEIKARLASELLKKQISLDEILKKAIRVKFENYGRAFGLIS